MAVVPGACAAVAGLTVSGFPMDRFCFEGFMPVKSSARCRRLADLAGETRTMIFYESPHRLVKTLKDIEEVLGDPDTAVARELTKAFEEVKTGKASEVRAYFSRKPVKGEIVLLVNLKQQ